MRCRTAKWFPIFLLFTVISSLLAEEKDLSDRHDNLTGLSVVKDNNIPTTNQQTPKVITDQLNKRSSSDYEQRIEPRSLFPILAAPRPSYGLPTKGYTPSKAPPISYPAARPPPVYYRPQQKPSHSYGPPKPTGYPASNHNYQEVYITYPPATNYPQPTGNYNQGGTYGSVSSGYPSNSVNYPAGTGSNYLQPSKPNYQGPVSFPNANYETPTYPAVTSKPLDNYGTATTPIPSYPSSQTNYPGYPAASGSYNPSPSYPASSGGSYYKPVTPAPTYPVYPAAPQPTYPAYPSPSYPTYPSTGGGSYHSSTGSTPPVFIFIPKPGYFNNKPTNHYKPTSSYPAPINYYPAPKPPVVTNTQYYPPPVKPLKPSGVYPPAKAPSTAYGLPKPQRPNPQHYHQHYHHISSNEIPKPIYSNVPAGNSYRTDNNINTISNLNLDNFSTKPFDYQSQVNPSGSTQLTTSAQPNLFQRGVQRPTDSQTTFSAVINDFTSFPEVASQSIDQTGRFKKNLSWPVGEESSQVVTVTELASTLNDLSNYRDDRGRFKNRQPQNDCGGSWVVLEQPGYVDPTQVQVEPIFPPFGKSLDQNFNDFQSSDDQTSFVTFPPFTPLESTKIEIPNNNYLIFSTTPNPDYLSTSEGSWRKPNSLKASPLSFFPSRSIPAEGFKGQIVTNRITVTKPEFTAPQQPTENSITFSSSEIENLRNLNDFESLSIEERPSPFLADTSLNSESDTTERDEIDPVTISSIDETEKLINLLRSANLRALSSLIRQAGIGPLLQEKGILINLTDY